MFLSVEVNVDVLLTTAGEAWISYRGAELSKGNLRKLDKFLSQLPVFSGQDIDPMELEESFNRFFNRFFLRNAEAHDRSSDGVGKRWVYKIAFANQPPLPTGSKGITHF